MLKHGYNEPVYTIGIIAKLLKVCPDTLRMWERKSLIKPARIGKNRFYSQYDIERLEFIKDLIRRKRINIQGVITILNSAPCWELKKCKPSERNACLVYKKKSRA